MKRILFYILGLMSLLIFLTDNSGAAIQISNDKPLVAVAEHGKIITSQNGTNWTLEESHTDQFLYGLTYGNNQYVAIGAGVAVTSTDGKVWSVFNLPAPLVSGVPAVLNIVFGQDQQYVAVGLGGYIITSPDGRVWTVQNPLNPTSPFNDLYGLTYANKHYTAVGALGSLWKSKDGHTWVQSNIGTSVAINNIIYAGEQYVAVGDNNILLTSSDEIHWTQQVIPMGLVYSFPPLDSLRDIIYAAGHYVIVGSKGMILTSPDGKIWTKQNSGTSKFLASVTYSNGQYFIVGEEGLILRSSDLVTWLPVASPIKDSFYKIV